MTTKKKILIVSRSFYPQNSPRSFRTTELAKEFARQGHKVTVLTPKNQEAHPAFEKEHGLTIKDLGQPRWKEVKIKGSGPVRIFRRLIKRFTNLLFQYPNIELMGMVQKSLENESDYDLMISIATPHPVHWGVAKARKANQIIAKTWVADCGDPFMGQENDSFKYPFYFKYVEKWFCRKADFITVPVEGAIDAYYPEFRSKIKVIPQGFRFDDIPLPKHPIKNAKPVFGYGGVFIPGRRDPSELLEYLVTTNKDFEFHVFTNTRHQVQPYAKASTGRIILHEPIDRTELLMRLSKMNFVAIFENVGTKQTPSKLIDYAIIKRPVLSIKTGTLDAVTVDQFLDGNYQNQLVIKDPDQYRIENVVARFLQLSEEKHP